jgi:uncharacterized membrane protein YfcA
MDLSPVDIATLSFCALFVGVSKSGFAGSVGILATPLLAVTLGAKEAVGLLLPLLFAADVFNFYHFWREWENRAVAIIVPGCLIGVLLGWPLLHVLKGAPGAEGHLGEFIGAAAIVFGLLFLYRELRGSSPTPFRPTWQHGLLAGAATGVVSTLAHQGGLVTQMYLIPQKLTAPVFVGTTTVIYFILNLSKVPIFVVEGLIDAERLWWSAVNLPLVFIGCAIGAYLNRRMSSRLFNRIVTVMVLITGLKLAVWPVLRGLWGMMVP